MRCCNNNERKKIEVKKRKKEKWGLEISPRSVSAMCEYLKCHKTPFTLETCSHGAFDQILDQLYEKNLVREIIHCLIIINYINDLI